jgi:hypothetical protein
MPESAFLKTTQKSDLANFKNLLPKQRLKKQMQKNEEKSKQQPKLGNHWC